jgi:hypothetical protein
MVRFKNRYILAEIEFASEDGVSQQVNDAALWNVKFPLFY